MTRVTKTTKTGTGYYTTINNTLTNVFKEIKNTYPNKYMTKRELVNNLMWRSKASEGAVYRFVTSLQTTNKINTVSLFRIN